MSSPGSPTPTIIIADDDPDMLKILLRLLQDLAARYELITVSEGAQALDLLGGRTVPLVITDYKMPGVDGITLASAIKQVSPTTQIVLITNQDTPPLEQRARAAGVAHCLAKPFPLKRFEQIVKDILQEP